MQAEPDSQSHLNNKGDVDGINFRPSSNFKHMRKYRKGAAASSGGESSGARSEEEDRSGPSSEWPVQPPLPRDPPPPDSPPLTLKTEVEDDEYRGDGTRHSECSADEQAADTADGNERTMCRQFARGACTRGSACIFAHEIIVSQLPGIYTFCKDFQNSTCTFSRCKFVHATVFEKEYFYRTGYLPPHATAHLKPTTVLPTSVPPIEGGQAGASTVFPNPPPGPVVHPGVSGVAVTGGGAEARPPADALAVTAAIPAIKPDWRDMDELGAAAARDTARPPEPPSKCGHCDINEYRLQCNKNKLEKVMRSSQELDKKMSALDKKIAKQKLILNSLMRFRTPENNSKPGANLFNNANFKNDIEKIIVEKLNMLLGHNGHAPPVDEPSKSLETVLKRWLRSTGETPPTAGPAPGPEPGPPPSR